MSLLDLILRLDEASLHEVMWSEDLLEELAEVWVRNGARDLEAATRVCGHIRETFAGQEVRRSNYEHLVADMPGDDPDDHLHAAAAVARAPATILTANLGDFPAEPLAALGVSVIGPDDYLCALWRRHPERDRRDRDRDGRRPTPTAHDHPGGDRRARARRSASVRHAGASPRRHRMTPAAPGSTSDGSQVGSQGTRHWPTRTDQAAERAQATDLYRHASTRGARLRIRRLGVRIPPSAQKSWSQAC
jgi:hypothetical protein